jgi:hypothetical protein
MFDLSSLDVEIPASIGDAIDVDYRLVVHSLGPFDCAFDIGLVDDAVGDVSEGDPDDGDDPSHPVYRTLHRQMRVYETAPARNFQEIIIKFRFT